MTGQQQPAALRWNVIYQGKYTRTVAGLTPVQMAFRGDGTLIEGEARAKLAAAVCPALLVINDPALKALGLAGWVVARSRYTTDQSEASMLVFQRSAYGRQYADRDPRETSVKLRRKSVKHTPERPLTVSEAEDAVRRLSPHLTIEDAVLFAVYIGCERTGRKEVDREVVALICDDLDSAKFAMRTAPDRLDTNRVYSKLSKSVVEGRLENPVKRLYRLTSDGRALVLRLGRSSTA